MGKVKNTGRQTKPLVPSTLLDPLDALQHLMERFDNRGVIFGGIAVSLLGQSRLTVDLDAVFLLSIDDLPKLIEEAKKEGMLARIVDAEDFAR